MYKSPIEIEDEIFTQIERDQENKIISKVCMVMNVNVDKDELIKALSYDRDQYAKGYNEGYEAGEKSAREKFCKILEYTLTDAINAAIKEWDESED